jgi:small subunit ribosomal protein S20
MVRHKSAVKAARQAEKRRAHNTTLRSAYKTVVKKLRTEIANAASSKTGKEAVVSALNEVQSVLMRAANRNLIKVRGASRRIARLSAAAHKAIAG